MKTPGREDVSLMLDSGAFSAWMKQEEISVEDYGKFLQQHGNDFDLIVNLDVIPGKFGQKEIPEAEMIKSIEQGWRNYYRLIEMGVPKNKLLHVFHQGEPFHYLEKMVKEMEYIGISPANDRTTKEKKKWLDECMKYIVDSKGKAQIKFHGFGMTSLHLIWRYPWFCMTEEDHEVLTKTGWKFREDLSIGEEVLTFDKGASKWERILDIPTFPVKDIDINVMENRNFCAKVTDNHNWITCPQYNRGNNWKWKTTHTLNSNDCIPRIGKYTFPETKIYMDSFIELLAWFWTDGTINKREKYNQDSISIYQSESANSDKCKMIQDLLNYSGEPHCKSVSKEDNLANFEMYGDITKAILEFAPFKKLPLDFIFDLTKEQLQKFVDICVLADGTDTKLVRRDSFNITVSRQVKKDNLEVLRIACLLLGIPTSISYGNQGYKTLQSSSVDYVYNHSLKKHKEKYTGNIWCLQVPSKAFFTRCDNKIYVTGNSIDSTTWVLVGAMGGVMMPKIKYGRYTYRQSPIILPITTKNDIKKPFHYQNLSEIEQSKVQRYFNDRGFDVKTLETEGMERDRANMRFFLDLEQTLTDTKVYFAGNFPMLHKMEREFKTMDLALKITDKWRRLGSYYHQNYLLKLLDLKRRK